MAATAKKPRKRGTMKQQKLAKVLIENLQNDKPINAGQMLANVGYSEHLAKQPGRVIESEGVKTELALLGFTEEKAKSVVSSIMNSEQEESKDRLKAAEMVFKVFGSFTGGDSEPPKTVHYNLFYKPEFQDTLHEFEAKAKEAIKYVQPLQDIPEA